MLIIHCPDNFLKERAYIFDIIFGEFLGIEYQMKVTPGICDYTIILENNNEVVFKDHFFSKFNDQLGYLKPENLPGEISFATNMFTPEADLPVLYGTTDLNIDEKPLGYTRIECGIDIFASSFLMLTRWEEYVSENKDQIGRFSSSESIACKNGFLHRPIVNEYLELLWNMLKYAGVNKERRCRKFTPYITHDVDFILRWRGLRSVVRTLASDLFKKWSIKAFYKDLVDFIQTSLKLKKDPYDTFDQLMTLSEKRGLNSYFFMMSVEARKHRLHYSLGDPFVRNLVAKIKNRGHKVGFHPDLNSYKSENKWESEVVRLNNSLQSNIVYGRQHYLQFEAPVTWQIWNDMGMKWDSTLSYDDEPGFRTGCCYSFSVFNFLTREKLDLKEKSLIIMDTALVLKNQEKGYQEMENLSRSLIDQVKKYRGDFVLLWHNSCFNVPEWKPFENLYVSIVDYLGKAA